MSEEKDINDIIMQNYDLVQKAAAKTARVSPYLSVDDLTTVGMVALWHAIESYDPQYEGFRSYAYQRIRWAIVDEIRRAGPFTRAQADKAKRISKKIERLKQELGREPTEDEVNARVPSLIQSGDFVDDFDTICADSDKNVIDKIDAKEDWKSIKDKVKHVLSRREMAVLELKYFHDKTHPEIEEILGLNTGLSSRALFTAFNKIRDELSGEGEKKRQRKAEQKRQREERKRREAEWKKQKENIKKKARESGQKSEIDKMVIKMRKEGETIEGMVKKLNEMGMGANRRVVNNSVNKHCKHIDPYEIRRKKRTKFVMDRYRQGWSVREIGEEYSKIEGFKPSNLEWIRQIINKHIRESS